MRQSTEMYLRPVILCCFIVGFIHNSQGGLQYLRCQTCDGVGSTMEEAQKDCNDNMEAVACFGENLLCVVYHDILYYNEGSNHTVFRKCANRDYFEKTKHLCDKTTILDGWECTVAKCDKSNCTAVLPKPVTRCPSCRSETSMRDCDRNIEINTCTGHDMRCVVYEVKHGEFIRECMDSDKYEVSENNFKQFSVCRGDECMARLPLCQDASNCWWHQHWPAWNVQQWKRSSRMETKMYINRLFIIFLPVKPCCFYDMPDCDGPPIELLTWASNPPFLNQGQLVFENGISFVACHIL